MKEIFHDVLCLKEGMDIFMNKQSPRIKRAEMAKETLNILQAWGYKNRRGLQVDLKEDEKT